MDEAMHPLTLLGLGLYGEVLPNQNGAPIRLVVPWKYGFKSIKSIVRVSFRRERADQHLEAAAVVRVRLLRQRQSAGRSPALVAGQRAPARRVLPAQDADVQRLRRSGRVPLQRDGSAEVLLIESERNDDDGSSSPVVWLICLAPFALLVYDGFTDNLTANPIEKITNTTGIWTLRLHRGDARDHAAALVHRHQSADQLPARWSACSRSSTGRCTSRRSSSSIISLDFVGDVAGRARSGRTSPRASWRSC